MPGLDVDLFPKNVNLLTNVDITISFFLLFQSSFVIYYVNLLLAPLLLLLSLSSLLLV